jgi:hypothetical protein
MLTLLFICMLLFKFMYDLISDYLIFHNEFILKSSIKNTKNDIIIN